MKGFPSGIPTCNTPCPTDAHNEKQKTNEKFRGFPVPPPCPSTPPQTDPGNWRHPGQGQHQPKPSRAAREAAGSAG